MKKGLYILLLTFGLTQAQYTQIPDSSFEFELVIDGIDDVVDGQVLTANIENVEELSLSWSFITDLSGIEDFQSLKILYVNNNELNQINLTQNLNLEFLNINYNNLTTLNLTGNPNLQIVTCEFNDLVSMELNQCFNLETLNCRINEISSIDVSNNINLIDLDISGNLINEIDLTNNLNLEILDVGGNNLSLLDLSNNDFISNLNCESNSITSLNLLDMPNLEFLQCRHNQITNLDVTNNELLINLFCGDNSLVNLNIDNNLNIERFDCRLNQIQSLDLSNNTELIDVDVRWNDLTFLNIRNGTNSTIASMTASFNNLLNCVEVDDAFNAENNLPPYNTASWHIPNNAVFSNDCTTIGIDDLANNINLSVYPNPVFNVLNIHNNSNLHIVKVNTYNQLGKLIIKSNSGSTINVSKLNKGIYFLKIKLSNGKTISKKIIKV